MDLMLSPLTEFADAARNDAGISLSRSCWDGSVVCCALVLEELQEFLDRQRLGIKPALGEFDPRFPQIGFLFDRLHPFGHDVQPQAVRHVYDMGNDPAGRGPLPIASMKDRSIFSVSSGSCSSIARLE